MEPAAAAAFGELLIGRFAGSEALATDLSMGTAVRFERWFAGIEVERPKFDVDVVLQRAADGDEFAHLVVRRWALSCVIAGDRALLDASLPPGDGGLAVARGWQELGRGESLTPVDVGAENSVDHAALVVEAVLLRALASLANSDLVEGRSGARRAFRMAQAEALPQTQYLAGIVLARYRRLSGHPPLALRIVRGLARVVPAPWHSWLAWEAVVAGGHTALDVPGIVVGEDGPARTLLSMLDAARAGDRAQFDARSERLASKTPFEFQAADVRHIRAGIDPSRHIEDGEPCHAFRTTEAPVPFGLDGLGADEPGAPTAAVCVHPDRETTRVLFDGAALFAGGQVLARATQRPRIGRTEAALVTACLAGPDGILETEFFRQTYGFAYERAIHRGVIGVLIHRMRDWLEGVAELERSDRIIIRPLAPFIVPDSKSARSVGAQVVLFLANRKLGTAKEAGSSLGVSLRSAQQALTDLVADGACERVRSGRRMSYQLTDTTFQDPTEF